MPNELKKLNLNYNPFEPAASGAPIKSEIWLPESWKIEIEKILDITHRGIGVKPMIITGEYGSGKTFILQWIHTKEFPGRRIKSFYFENPGVQFYSLANSLLRQIGRKEFSKSIWELAGIYVSGIQRSLFADGFESFLLNLRTSNKKSITISLKDALLKLEITDDEEIAMRLAEIVAETPLKPYFEYRDFIAGRRGSVVAEGEEAKYFKAILKILRVASGIDSVAFLIDEFEEISLEKRLTKKEAYGYLATLKRLINLSASENLWVILSMHPEAVSKTESLEPSLWERFTSKGKYQFNVPKLSIQDAEDLVHHRLKSSYIKIDDNQDNLFPFEKDAIKSLTPAIYSNPRRLIQACFFAISDFKSKTLPISAKYMKSIKEKLYPNPIRKENK